MLQSKAQNDQQADQLLSMLNEINEECMTSAPGSISKKYAQGPEQFARVGVTLAVTAVHTPTGDHLAQEMASNDDFTDSLSSRFNDEIEAWARRALGANGFGGW